jgi:hypothetical protein
MIEYDFCPIFIAFVVLRQKETVTAWQSERESRLLGRVKVKAAWLRTPRDWGKEH